MLNKPDAPSDKKEAVVVKKYANRRLYNTETSTYVTLEDLATMVRSTGTSSSSTPSRATTSPIRS
jgi:polyhydroxyalkanoate synthesis regulator protein